MQSFLCTIVLAIALASTSANARPYVGEATAVTLVARANPTSGNNGPGSACMSASQCASKTCVNNQCGYIKVGGNCTYAPFCEPGTKCTDIGNGLKTCKATTTTTSAQPATTTTPTAQPSNVAYGGACTDSNQCSGSLYCVNGVCDF